MTETKPTVDVIPVMSKITENKFMGSNYMDWSKTIRLYLWSIDKENHLVDDPPKDETKSVWLKEDAKLFLQIKNSMHSEVNDLVSHYDYVKDLMDYLDFLYSSKGNLSCMYDVCQAFYHPSMQDHSLTTYFSEFKKVYDELNVILPFSPDVKVQQAQREQLAVMSFLSGLSPEFEGAKSQILSGTAISSLKEAFTRVLHTEKSHPGPTATIDSGALLSHVQRIGVILQNKNKRSQYANIATSETISPSQSSSPPINTIPESGKTTKCLLSSSSKWVIDSGATDHMTGSGTVNPTSSLSLSSVLNLPDFSFNLIYDLTTKQIIGKGSESGGLYVLESQVPKSISCSTVLSPFDVHCRLGHPSLSSLKKLYPQFQSISSLSHVTKLDPKALKCVFLGYSRLQKGYRCYSPDLKSPEEEDDTLVYTVTHPVSSPTPLPQLPVSLDRPSEQPPVLRMYTRRQQTSEPDPLPTSASSVDPTSCVSDPSLDLPIAIHKGTRQCTYPISSFVSYDHLSTSSSSFIASLDSARIPKTVREALSHPGWNDAMIEEMMALDENGTWELADLPTNKKAIGYKWVFAVKFNSDRTVACLKARLVAKGYAQTYGVDYLDTFSPVAKLASVRLFISMATTYDWPLHQLDIKNAFLHGDLQEEVYMEQPPGFVAQGECGKVCRLRKSLYGLKQSPHSWFGRFSEAVLEYGMKKNNCDHTVFYKKSDDGILLLVVYVDDIVITGSDITGISTLKSFLHTQFQTKDLGQLKYFLGVEVTRSKKGIFLSQRKYTLDLLAETGKLGSKPCNMPMVPNTQLVKEDGELFEDPEKYRRLVGKLNYLTVTRPDIAYSVSIVSQFMSSPTMQIGQGQKPIGYPRQDIAFLLGGGNLISWKSKKQNVVSRSSAEAEYRAMAQFVCEVVWVHQLLSEVGFQTTLPAKLWCGNQAALHISSNPVFHERTKHIEIDCHFVREKIQQKLISTGHVRTGDQLGDIFTKALNGARVEYILQQSLPIGKKHVPRIDILCDVFGSITTWCKAQDTHLSI
ncbi:uncharacterized protein LOC107793242 [Nicotiana tabacum]|uniref:Uncharacterized protein LOC107793242 n=1 Tax=Nicotiana tabacum TaxID=4097 RepID=A0AC58RV86_TOBAC